MARHRKRVRVPVDVGRCPAELDAVAVLARIQLEARRGGWRIELVNASGDLRALLDLTGLARVLPCSDALPVERRRQPEQRKEAPGVEEPVEPGDPPA